MEELQKENAELKAKNTKLESLINELLAENKYLKEKIRQENKARIRHLSFTKKPKPTLFLDHHKVELKSSIGKTVTLLEELFRTGTIDRMKKSPVSIEELYDLIYGDQQGVDWFSLDSDRRAKAKSEIRGLIRNINNETKVYLDGEDLFIPENNCFKINKKVTF